MTLEMVTSPSFAQPYLGTQAIRGSLYKLSALGPEKFFITTVSTVAESIFRTFASAGRCIPGVANACGGRVIRDSVQWGCFLRRCCQLDVRFPSTRDSKSWSLAL